MKRFAIFILAVLFFGLGLAFAQNETTVIVIDETPADNYWAGLSFGYPGVNGHFGISNALGQDIDVRANLGITYFGGFAFGADALFGLPINVDPDVPLEFYVGGGPVFGFVGAFDFGLDLLAGGEYRLTQLDFPAGGVFFEMGPRLIFTRGFGAGFNARLGFNYHF